MELKTFRELKTSIDRRGPVLLYYQIEKELERMIREGIILPGAKLPGDLLLGEILEVNPWTVRKAFSNLTEKGLVKRTRRAGTFVNENITKLSPSIGFFYFIEDEVNMLKRAEYVQNYFTRHGFDLKLVGFQMDYYETADLYHDIKQKDVKGALIVPLGGERCKKSLRKLEAHKFPYVRFGNVCFTGELTAPLVRGNARKRMVDVLNYLWNLGHRKIGLVCNYLRMESRIEYRDFYQARGGFKERWLMSTDFSGTYEQWQKLPGPQIATGYLEINSDLTALIVEHGAACVDFLRQLTVMNKNVPEDISLVCLSDWKWLDLTSPQITAMNLPDKEMAETAGKLLLEIIKKGPRKKEEIVQIEYQRVERESVAAPACSVELVDNKHKLISAPRAGAG